MRAWHVPVPGSVQGRPSVVGRLVGWRSSWMPAHDGVSLTEAVTCFVDPAAFTAPAQGAATSPAAPEPRRIGGAAVMALCRAIIRFFTRHTRTGIASRSAVVRARRRLRFLPFTLIGDALKATTTVIYMSHPAAMAHVGAFKTCARDNDPLKLPIRAEALSRRGRRRGRLWTGWRGCSSQLERRGHARGRNRVGPGAPRLGHDA
jgi:hypothetical protein